MPYIGTTPTKVVSRQSANVYRYTATAGQTAFTGADLDNQVLACNPADLAVHMNGLRLESTDYTATSTTVTLTTAATAGDEVTVTAFSTFEVADTYTKATADGRYVNSAGDTMTGTLNATGMTRNTNGLRIGASNAATGYGLRIGASGATDPLEIWRDHANGDQMQLSVDYYGRVTMPYQPSFCASRNADQSRTENAAIADLVYDQVIHNIGGHYNSSNGRFTAPISGAYMFSFGARLDSIGATYTWIRLDKNGTTQSDDGFPNCITQQTGSYFTIGASGCVYLNADDYVSVSVYVSGDASWEFENASFFSGHLLG